MVNTRSLLILIIIFSVFCSACTKIEHKKSYSGNTFVCNDINKESKVLIPISEEKPLKIEKPYPIDNNELISNNTIFKYSHKEKDFVEYYKFNISDEYSLKSKMQNEKYLFESNDKYLVYDIKTSKNI